MKTRAHQLLIFLIVVLFYIPLQAQSNERSPFISGERKNISGTEAIWDLQASFPLGSQTSAAIFDGTYIYTVYWNSDLIHKYDLSGILIEVFSIPGVSGLRDLAYDGTYFYGGTTINIVYQMDFITHTLVNTFPSPVPVRHIAYDSDNDGFWVGNWNTEIYLIERSGVTVASFGPTVGVTNLSGSAYDNITAGGPYLWLFGQSGSGAEIHQVQVPTGIETGVFHNVLNDIGSAGDVAGGLFCSTDFVPGFFSIGGVLQSDPDILFIYEIASLNPGPGPATNPTPTNGATGVGIDDDLFWDNTAGATEIEIFWNGTSVYTGAPITTWDPGTLDWLTSYTWKINQTDSTGTTGSPTWNFTTMQNPLFQPFWSEDFDGSNSTITWSTINNGGNCDWEILPFDPGRYQTPNADGNHLVADSDLCGTGTTMNTTFQMDNGINLSQYYDIILSYDSDFKFLGTAGERGTVEYSIDGGATWTVLVTYTTDVRNEHFEMVVPEFSFQPDVRLRFVYVAPGWDWWWSIDNITIDSGWWYYPPYPPSNLTAIAILNQQPSVHLSWQDNSNDEDGFDVARKLGPPSSPYSYYSIGQTGTNITTYIDTTVEYLTEYTYVVVAHSWVGPSAWSNEATVFVPIPVELTGFEAIVEKNNIILNWITATETNNSHFEIERTTPHPPPSQGGGDEVGVGWEKIGRVDGHGTTTESKSYSFTDNSVTGGTYNYRLKQVDYDGSFEYSETVEVTFAPIEFALEQNYPNPFNPSTTIKFAIPTDANVSLKLYNTLGQEIAEIINAVYTAGIYEINFDGSELSSGIYFYRIEANGIDGQNFISIKKMVVMK